MNYKTCLESRYCPYKEGFNGKKRCKKPEGVTCPFKVNVLSKKEMRLLEKVW